MVTGEKIGRLSVDVIIGVCRLITGKDRTRPIFFSGHLKASKVNCHPCRVADGRHIFNCYYYYYLNSLSLLRLWLFLLLSLFHPRLKSHLLHKSFPPQTSGTSPTTLTSRTLSLCLSHFSC